MLNRPFHRGQLTKGPCISAVTGLGGSDWRVELGAFQLKFILSHPAVTVAIPATTRHDQVTENVAAALDPLPDAKLCERMAAYVRNL